MPVGSVLLCSKEKYDEALKFRKIFGGGMRQSGYLAACGIYALKNNINRLAEDHKRAFDIGKKLETLSFVRKVEDVESNIVIFEIDHKIESQKFLDELNKREYQLYRWVIISLEWLLILIILKININFF